MSQLLSVLLEQIDKMIPERYRVQLVACTAFCGLLGWIYVSNQLYAKVVDVQETKAEFAKQLTAAIAPLSAAQLAQRNLDDQRYLQELSQEILDTGARCNETKSAEARGLYRSALVDLLRRYEHVQGQPYPKDVGCN